MEVEGGPRPVYPPTRCSRARDTTFLYPVLQQWQDHRPNIRKASLEQGLVIGGVEARLCGTLLFKQLPPLWSYTKRHAVNDQLERYGIEVVCASFLQQDARCVFFFSLGPCPLRLPMWHGWREASPWPAPSGGEISRWLAPTLKDCGIGKTTEVALETVQRCSATISRWSSFRLCRSQMNLPIITGLGVKCPWVRTWGDWVGWGSSNMVPQIRNDSDQINTAI